VDMDVPGPGGDGNLKIVESELIKVIKVLVNEIYTLVTGSGEGCFRVGVIFVGVLLCFQQGFRGAAVFQKGSSVF